MNDLAIVISTCDKYSYLWDGWWYYFNKNWDHEIPAKMYFYSENKVPDFPNIKYFKVGDGAWTARLRRCIEQVPEKNILLLLEDLYFVKKFTKEEFMNIYNLFKDINADALRIVISPAKRKMINTKYSVNGITVQKLYPRSQYLICYMTNIWKKSFLEECIKYDENPWISETKGTQRLYGGEWNVYNYVKPNFLVNVVKQGVVTASGRELLKQIK